MGFFPANAGSWEDTYPDVFTPEVMAAARRTCDACGATFIDFGDGVPTHGNLCVMCWTHTRPLHVNDQGAGYHDGPIRPMDGHDPRVTVAACPACR